MSKTYQIKCNEDEVKAIIAFHTSMHHDSLTNGNVSVERSKRIHDLTKRIAADGDANEAAEEQPNSDAGEVPATQAVPQAWS